MSDSMELMKIEPPTALQAFTSGTIDALLEKIATSARAQVSDATTPDGRKSIASLAHKVARSKTALDDMGKTLVADWKAQAKVVDAERKKARDFLDDLKAQVRQPLTDFEEQEEARVEGIEGRLVKLLDLADMPPDAAAADLKARRELAKAVDLREDWQEYLSRATEIKEDVVNRLATLILAATKREADAAELAHLREESAERERREQEDKIRAEAAEKARRAAEQEAREIAAEVERERRWLDETARLCAENLERERRARADAAELREQQLQRDAQRALAEAEDAKLAAAAAVETERRRVEAEKEEEAAAALTREANRTHRATINRDAAAALIEHGLSKNAAQLAVNAIAQHVIPNVTISY